MVRKLFLTPSTAPEGHYTRCVRVPASQQWLAVFNRALLLLADPANWEQLYPTDITPDVAASRSMDIYVDWLTGVCSLDCQDVLSCLGPALADLLRAGTINPNSVDPADTTAMDTRFPAAARGAEILPPPADCNLDELWSGLLEIVTRIDGNGRDFWEEVAAEADTIERVGAVISLVPLFGDIVGELIQLVADIAPDVSNLYNSHSSQSVIEAIACDLFGLVCAECRYPTYQELYDYYSGRSALGAAVWAELAFEAAVDALLGLGTAAPAVAYYTTNIVQMLVLGLGGTWLHTHGAKFVALWAGLGASGPSSNWELLCGPCGEAETWSFDFDLTQGLQGWNVRSDQGVWTPQGVAGTQYGTQYILQVNRAWGGPINITGLVAHFESANINNGNFTSGMRATPTGTPFDFIVQETGVSEQPHDMEFSGNLDRTGPLIFVFGSSFNAQLYLTSIHVEGTGPGPSW